MGFLTNEERWLFKKYPDEKLKATAVREVQIDTSPADSDSETEFEQDCVLDVVGWDTVSAKFLYDNNS